MPPDYSRQNLRGQNFKGQDLAGANFSYADIRSANFTDANLKGANFSHAKAGLQKRWATFLVCVSLLLSGISGLFSAFAGALVSLIFDTSSLENQVTGWTILIVIIVVFVVVLSQGLNSAFVFAGVGAFAVAGAGAVAGAVAFVFAFVFAGFGAFTNVEAFAVVGAGAIAGAIAVAVGFAGAGAIAGAVAFAITVAGAFAFAVTFAVTVAGAVAGAVAFAVAFTVAFIGAVAGAFAFTSAVTVAVVGAVVLAGAGVLLSAYIARRAIEGDEKYALIRNIAVAFAATGGTSFYNANLTDADFSAATLKSTDFREAILTRTCFKETNKLDYVRSGTTYLQKAQLRKVLVTLQGEKQIFDREDLEGVNFQGANLVNASFIGADLSKANLQKANLSGAKLVQTQLNGTDFTGAILTKAYIQDWNITINTKFDGVRCEYVYMRVPTEENSDPLRKPDNNKEVFADGGFGDFIKPIFDTLDLYHNSGVDPRAVAIAFKELAENNLEAELEIVAVEKRGEDKILLRVQTAATADKSKLSKEYFINYNQLKALAEKDFKALAEKDSTISSLETTIKTIQSSNAAKTILILAVNPKTTLPLRLDEEVREIDAGLQRAKKREQFDLKQKWAVRVRDVSQALLDFKPQIVHFSGHGSGDDGLALEDETGNVRLVETQALAELFKLFANKIECVVLNACYSEVQAKAIAQHIPYVIGMDKEIGDKAGIEFAVGFYAALGAGESIEFAYQFGCNAIQLAGLREHLTPVLKKM